MSIFQHLKWAWRHSSRRFFESLLIVLAIGLGIAVIVSILSLVTFTTSQIGDISSDEWMRTFRIYSAAHYSSSTGREPILKVVEERPTEPISVSLSELNDIQDALPAGMHVFAERNFGYPTRLLPKSAEQLEAEALRYEAFAPMQAYVSETVVISEEVIVMEDIEDIEDFEEEIIFPEYHYTPDRHEYLMITGTTLEYFKFKEYEIATGNFFFEEDLKNGNQVLVISDALATRLFPDQDPIGAEIPFEVYGPAGQDVNFTVIGVLEPFPEGDDNIYRFDDGLVAFAPYTAQPSFYGDSDQEHLLDSFTIGVAYHPDLDLQQAAATIQAEIGQRFGNLAVVNSSYISIQEADTTGYGIYIIIAIFASIGLVIAVINILNLMLARVLRRTKSIGLSIALGASKIGVFGQFLLEAVTLGLVGALIGLGFTFLLLKLLANLVMMEITLGFTSIAAGCGLGLIVSLLFGVYPAYQAATTNPVDALRNA